MAYLGNVGKSTFVLQGILAFKVIPGETLGETLGEWRGQLLWKYRRSAFSNFSENEIYDGSLISEHFIQFHLIQIKNRLMFYVYIQIFIQQKAFLLCCRGEGVHMIYIYIWLALQQKIIWPHLSTTTTYKTVSLHAPQRPEGYLALPWQLLQTAGRSYCSNGRHCTFQSARRSHLPSMDPEGRWARSIWWCHLSSPTSSVAIRVASLKALLRILLSIGGKRW